MIDHMTRKRESMNRNNNSSSSRNDIKVKNGK